MGGAFLGSPRADVKAPLVATPANNIDYTSAVAKPWRPTQVCWTRATAEAVTLTLSMVYDSVEYIIEQQIGYTEIYRCWTRSELPDLPEGAELHLLSTGGAATQTAAILYEEL